MIQDWTIVTTECEQETVPKLSNGTISVLFSITFDGVCPSLIKLIVIIVIVIFNDRDFKFMPLFDAEYLN